MKKKKKKKKKKKNKKKKRRTTTDLVLFLLESGLGLLEGGLELLLLDFETPALFVDLVDVAAALADLVHQVLDLICGRERERFLGQKLQALRLSGGFVPERFLFSRRTLSRCSWPSS